MLALGDLCRVNGGKYDGKSGAVVSVGASTCRLRIDGAETGNLKLTALTAIGAPPATPPRGASAGHATAQADPGSGSAFRIGETVHVTTGKYAGRAGVITAATPKSCKLRLLGGVKEGEEEEEEEEATGYLAHAALRHGDGAAAAPAVAAPHTPPAAEKARAQPKNNSAPSPGSVAAFATAGAAGSTSISITAGPSMRELKAFREAHGIAGVALAGPGRTRAVVAAELLEAAAATASTALPVQHRAPAPHPPSGDGGGATAAAPPPRALCISALIDDLDSTTADCELVARTLRRKGFALEPPLITDGGGRTGRVEVLRKLGAFLAQEASLFLLYFSGHGDVDGGALMVGHGGRRGLVSFADLLSAWDSARGRRRGLKLVVVVDACYSGKLVSALRRLPRREQEGLNLAVQSAGNARQCVEETGAGRAASRHGGVEFEAGVFTCYWATKQEQRVRWTKPEAHPQFYATWDPSSKDKERFAIPVPASDEELVMYSQPEHR